MSLRFCPRCRAAHDGKCPEVNKRLDRERGSAWSRGYDSDWRTFRHAVLLAEPWCRDCRKHGRWIPAQELHHVAKVADAPERRLDPENVMPLCKRCHSARTARGE